MDIINTIYGTYQYIVNNKIFKLLITYMDQIIIFWQWHQIFSRKKLKLQGGWYHW